MIAEIPHTKLNDRAIIVEYSNPSTANNGLASNITSAEITARKAAKISISTKLLYFWQIQGVRSIFFVTLYQRLSFKSLEDT
jgi:hypothetical protein